MPINLKVLKHVPRGEIKLIVLCTLLSADKSAVVATNAHPALASQATLSYRVAVATDAKPRVEISLLNLCRGTKEGNS